MHPYRKETRNTQVAKMKTVAGDYDKCVEPGAAEWNEFGHGNTIMRGEKLGYPLGENEPEYDVADNTRMVNKNPKEFRP